MKDLFVTCFWGSDPIRIKLCQEFCIRYPQVHLLQNGKSIKSGSTTSYEIKKEGFIDYMMINKYLDEIGLENIRTFTIIDSDLILSEDFFEEITRCHKTQICSFVTYRRNYQLVNGKIYDGCCSKIYNSINNLGQDGHSGYILSFNYRFLREYRFPENFICSFDYFLVCSLLGKCIKGFEEEYKRVPKGVAVNYIECDVIHQWHPPRIAPSLDEVAKNLVSISNKNF